MVSRASLLRNDMRRRRSTERVVETLLLGAAGVSVLTTFGIVLVLIFETFAFFQAVPLTDFFFGNEWAPLSAPQRFGVLPLVTGTLLVAGIAGIIAMPVGLLIAIYLAEYASGRTRRVVKPLLEVLAGIPTVVFGYFALTFV